MKILFATSECYPFLKTGGLADVAYALPKELLSLGEDCRVIMPNYGTISREYSDKMEHLFDTTIKIGWREQYLGVKYLRHEGVHYYFIDNMYYFHREAPYGYFDDGERFSFFSQAILEILTRIDFVPDILHCNDWHTAVIPVLIRTKYRWEKKFENVKTMLTIHNLRFQGIYPPEVLGNLLGIGNELLQDFCFEYFGNVNYLKGGINYADVVTTVSPTYAEEIKTEYFGEGLHGVMEKVDYKLKGILNGIDYRLFNPRTDKNIPFHFGLKKIEDKVKNKLALQKELGLDEREDVPMFGIISRMTDQKGFDLIAEAIEEMLGQDIQLVVLGTGERRYEDMFRYFSYKYPNKVSTNLAYNGELAQKIYAASDFFLMPSQFEPCGLSQLMALRYGTLPIVRETGGLKDTVVPYNKFTGEGIGFTFSNYDSYDMLQAIYRALEAYRDTSKFRNIILQGMRTDYSWKSSAKMYQELYKDIL
ncbi:MAG TPA: glycogen synthase GlgA [Clostridiaceae bacterium]|nr:glycogen synthase GlgA [Clostridiaceae bacterium]